MPFPKKFFSDIVINYNLFNCQCTQIPYRHVLKCNFLIAFLEESRRLIQKEIIFYLILV